VETETRCFTLRKNTTNNIPVLKNTSVELLTSLVVQVKQSFLQCVCVWTITFELDDCWHRRRGQVKVRSQRMPHRNARRRPPHSVWISYSQLIQCVRLLRRATQ